MYNRYKTNNSSSSSSSGIGVLGLLGVLFVALKLTGFIDWSWWWVTLPFWGLGALVVIVLSIYFLVQLTKARARRKQSAKRLKDLLNK